MNEEKAKAMVKRLLLSGLDAENEEKLHAVVYMVELEMYRRNEEEITGVSFCRGERGPYSSELTRIIEDVREDTDSPPSEGRATALSGRELSMLDALTDGVNRLSRERILREARNTTPYLSTAKNKPIDLSTTLTYTEKGRAVLELFEEKGWKTDLIEKVVERGKPKIRALWR